MIIKQEKYFIAECDGAEGEGSKTLEVKDSMTIVFKNLASVKGKKALIITSDGKKHEIQISGEEARIRDVPVGLAKISIY